MGKRAPNRYALKVRLLISSTMVVAGWVCFVGATFNAYALIATVGFGIVAAFCLWAVPRATNDV
jgi:hypothetical protein